MEKIHIYFIYYAVNLPFCFRLSDLDKAIAGSLTYHQDSNIPNLDTSFLAGRFASSHLLLSMVP
jgi:hypothetical protein